MVEMISYLIRLMDDNTALLKEKLKELARLHGDLGVQADHYSIMMEVLMFSLEHVLGSLFDPETKISWAKNLSRVLEVLIPAHLTEEVRLLKFDTMHPVEKSEKPVASEKRPESKKRHVNRLSPHIE